MNKILCEILNSTLCKRPLEEDLFQRVTEADWQRCFDLALRQNVLAMTFPTMSSLSKELRPSFTLWSKWMAYAQNIAEQNRFKREVVKKFGSWLAEDGLSTTLIKGFSLSVLYPNPNLREFSDIDIFSGKDYDAVNSCFAKHGLRVDSVDGHHAYLKVDGISVEHHFAFHNTKVKNGLVGPEEVLQQLAIKDWRPTSLPGICFPNPVFSALFVGWHAYEHFLQEKIQLRHIIDWVLALQQLSEEESVLLSEIKDGARWGLFTDTLTAIALHQLGLPQEWFSRMELDAGSKIELGQEMRVWNDIMKAPYTPHGKTSTHRRIYIAKRMLKNGWKYNAFANVKAHELLWEEFVAHVKTNHSFLISKS